jgi:NADH-quinone oxidoreductase subunit C
MEPEQVRAVLEQAGADRVAEADYALRGVHVDASFAPEKIRDAAQALRDREFLVEDVTAVDAEANLMVVYHFSHIGGNCRAKLRVLADRERPEVPSIQDIFSGANWHERETHDFYGVTFVGHPDLSPLILPEDAGDLHPLRKEGKGLKALGDVIPELAPPAPAGEEVPEAPKPKRKPAPEGEGTA